MVNAIEAQDLSKLYGRTKAVDGVTLSVPVGEVFGYLGLNGAGKTTTVRMLTGVLLPTSGRARVGGIDLTESPGEVSRRIGVVFDGNIVPEPRWSPVRYLRYFGRLYGLDPGTVDARIRELFGILELSPFAERPTGTLSGGNKRKVELARALLHEPPILFLDEPSRELDIPAKKAVWDYLKSLSRDGITIFLSSHDVQEISELCSRVAILTSGRLAWQGGLDELATERSLTDALAHRLRGGGAGKGGDRVPGASPPSHLEGDATIPDGPP